MADFTSLQEELDKERRKVDVDHFDITVREIVRMTTEQELLRAPTYQRKFRWDHEDESKLIESLFLGLPVPSIFVATNTDSKWELVDGLQRVSTLIHYTVDSSTLLNEIGKDAPLRLQGLEKLSTFNGLTFSELPNPIQLAFWKRSLRVTALSDKSDAVVRFDLFERLNTGGIALSPQEVRACIFRGKFAEFLRELSQDAAFQSIIKLQDTKKQDGTSEELVLKFFAYLYDRDNFKGNVKGFLNKYMEKSLKSFDYDEGRNLFHQTVNGITASLQGPFVRASMNVTPLNQLEAVMVGVGEVILRNGKIRKLEPEWIEDPVLVKYSTGATNTRPKLDGRINRAMELFGEFED